MTNDRKIECSACEKHPAMLALENLTPGGSEFYEDIPRCVDWIKDRINHNFDMAKKARKEANELEQHVSALRAVAERMADALDFYGRVNPEKFWEGDIARSALAEWEKVNHES
jgi:hypothetical protein